MQVFQESGTSTVISYYSLHQIKTKPHFGGLNHIFVLILLCQYANYGLSYGNYKLLL